MKSAGREGWFRLSWPFCVLLHLENERLMGGPAMSSVFDNWSVPLFCMQWGCGAWPKKARGAEEEWFYCQRITLWPLHMGGEEVDDEDQKHIFSVTRRPRSDGSLSLPPSPNTRGPFLIIIDVWWSCVNIWDLVVGEGGGSLGKGRGDPMTGLGALCVHCGSPGSW